LNHILNGQLNIKVKSINTEVIHHKTIKGNDINCLQMDVSFYIPEEPVHINTYQIESYQKYEDMSRTYHRLDYDDLLKIILTKQLINKFSSNISIGYMEPLAWVDKNGNINRSSDINFTGDGYNLIVGIDKKHTNKPTISIIVDFDISKYDIYYRYKTKPNIIADYKNNLATLKYSFGSISYPTKKMLISDNNIDIDAKYTLLADMNSTPIKLVFSDTKEQYNVAELSWQIICTPFSVAFDVVTSPVQLVLGILLIASGHIV